MTGIDRIRDLLRPVLAPTDVTVLRDRRDRLTVRATDGSTTVAARLDRTPDPAAVARAAAALEAAARVGVAPRCLLADPDSGLIVTEWVPGDPWTDDDLRDPDRLDALAATLRTVHGIRCDLPPFDLAGHVATYRARAPADLGEEVEELAALADRHLATRAIAGLGHHDVHVGNLVGCPPVLIDWEYAARSDPALDVATVTALHPLAPRARARFLDAFPELDRDAFPGHERLVTLLARVWTRLELRDEPADGRALAWAARLGLSPEDAPAGGRATMPGESNGGSER